MPKIYLENPVVAFIKIQSLKRRNIQKSRLYTNLYFSKIDPIPVKQISHEKIQENEKALKDQKI